MQRLLTVATGRRTHASCHQAVIQIGARCSPEWLLSEALRLFDSSRWVPHLPAEGRPRTRPEYFMRLPAGLEATGATVSLDELPGIEQARARILTRHR
jgi:hypothetical protein